MYTVIVHGVEVRCDTVEEAKRLARSVAMEGGIGTTTAKGLLKRPPVLSPDTHAAKLLSALHEAESSGVTGGQLAARLGLGAVKGLGPIVAAMNKKLSAHGIRADQVIRRRRVGRERIWFAGKKIDRALMAIGD